MGNKFDNICNGNRKEDKQKQNSGQIMLGKYLNKQQSIENNVQFNIINNESISLNEQEELQKALQHRNLEEIIQQLNNDNGLYNEVLDISHPWASGPETIGSLALIYFGICYKQSQNNLYIKQHFDNLIINFNIVQQLSNNLNSYMSDRKELTTLLIYFLVKKNTSIQNHLISSSLLLPLINLIKNNQMINLRKLAIKICIKLYSNRQEVIEQFINNQGVEQLKQFLNNCEIDDCKTALRAIDHLTFLTNQDETKQSFNKGLEKLKELQLDQTLNDLILKIKEESQDISELSCDYNDISDSEQENKRLGLAAQILRNNIINHV